MEKFIGKYKLLKWTAEEIKSYIYESNCHFIENPFHIENSDPCLHQWILPNI